MKKLFSFIIISILIISNMMTGCAKKSADDTWVGYEADTTAATATTDNKVSDSAVVEESTGDINYDQSATDDADNSYSKVPETFSKIGDIETELSDTYAFKSSDFGLPVTPNTEEYAKINETGFKNTTINPLSTFSIDVDTASYANLRKNLAYGISPEADAVRIEEMLNYFSYDYEEPSDGKPFSIHTEIGKCPWNEEHYLLTVGLQGKKVDMDKLPKSNLVFLIDVSGSMDEPDKLPLLINAFSQLVEVLGEDDRVSIVVYAGESGVILDSVRGDEKEIIMDSLGSLTAGGSTGGAGGLEKAYSLAQKNFIPTGNNRVILATDGDFNVGPSSTGELEDIISEKRDSGIFLSVMGFGSGNLKDNKMELLADQGNGNYSYIDSPMEARKVLVDEMSGTLLTIAKDVKIQLEFNPYSVESYRLIGYENRALQDEDFKNDTVDAGELGAGHTVTAIYEVIPARGTEASEDLKYQSQNSETNKEYWDEISEVRLRYKEPDEEVSKEIIQVVSFGNTPVKVKNLSEDFYFKAAVAEFGMLLRNSQYQGNSTIDSILSLAEQGVGEDEGGYRMEFISLVEQYQELISYRW